MKFDIIARVSVKMFLPFILLFGLYIQFHGDYGPGGGFQAGVIIASAIIIYALVFGLFPVHQIVPLRYLRLMMSAGVLIYLSTGILTMILGGNYLEYSVLAHDQIHGQEWGIFFVETGVLITVTGTMTGIFYAFVGRGR